MLSTSTNVFSRFVGKINRLDGQCSCWEWTGALMKNGYGAIRIGSKKLKTSRTEYSHRVSWVLAYGNIPNGLSVLHKYDNRKCVRPSHLFLGTLTDNMRDMVDKDRWSNQYKDNPPTHCKRGHEFSKSNTRKTKRGRICRACAAFWMRNNRRKIHVA